MKRLVQLRSAEQGNVLAVVAAMLPLMVGAGGLTVDAVSWALKKREVQRAADSAAIAAAAAKQQGSDAEGGANDILESFAGLHLVSEPTVEDGPTSGPYASDNSAVRVRLEATGRLTFTSMFLSDPVPINATATAAVTAAPRYCMLSLQDDDTAGITYEGSTNLDLNCGLATNSTGNPAMRVLGSNARITTTELSAVGALATAANYLGSPKFFPGSPPQEDPFEDVPVPSSSTCGTPRVVGGGATVSLTPGCFRGLDVAGTLNLAPGVYVIKDNPLRFAGSSRITGTGVTFVLTGTSSGTVSRLTIEGGATVNLTAPSSGDYAGLVFMQDRNASSFASGVEATNVLAGNSSVTIKGAMYFPKQRLQITGGGAFTASCLRVVAKRLHFTGNSSAYAQSCPSDDDFRAFGTRVRLVT